MDTEHVFKRAHRVDEMQCGTAHDTLLQTRTKAKFTLNSDLIMKSLEAGYSILALRQFHERHPAAAFACLGDSEYLLNLWANDDLRFQFSDTLESVAACLNNIVIDPSFDAICHVDTHQVEFFFRYVDPTDPWASPFLARRFTVNFQNHDFECWFEAPTERAMLLARSSHRLPSDPTEHIVSQIRQFRDAQRLPELSEHIQKYFSGKVPLNFFVSTEQFPQVDLRDLARHINVLTSYYDRQSPVIVIRTEATNAQGKMPPHLNLLVNSGSGRFPS